MGDSNQLTVKTEFGDVVVHRMPLSDYAEILRALDTLPKKIGDIIGQDIDFKNMETADILTLIPTLLADSWNDIGALLAVPTDKDKDFLLKLDGADAIDVLDAIMELNDFKRIFNAVKKMLARRAKTATPQPQPAPTQPSQPQA